ncbi:MAG: PEP-CTERM sorting domain-containing protein [Leptolyngbyaceae cyanobacterium RM2_2_4]|nr:PEP-CTERM sorting domain-containing protein [Leptolyngbyaceae cyanobacterium SM1_4_3]NJN58268.1 PEP-CTERM sorting domain-containing protein [Leptolyngbyaceae cyanobacterium SL_5_9]NJO49572.1 PEP-CTERM sorting domain-containing protein [Leptolyngbyaceae cyanobacterium RM2_2_4]
MNIQTVSSSARAVIGLLVTGSLLAVASAASAVTLKVSIENLAPSNGTLLTPLWVGFHNGDFDIYDRDVSLDLFPGTESLVEDGATQEISDRFTEVGAGTVQGTIFGAEGTNNGPIDVGETATLFFEVDPTLSSSRFFSYASMVIPSNDAFIANGNPTAHPIFDEAGNFIGADFIELGADVLDGGTEVNDELPMNTAFFGQTAPNTGVDENGVVTIHPGFNSVGSGGILDAPQFANADFKAEGYQVARIRVELVEEDVQDVPEPTTVLGMLAVGGAFWLSRRHRENARGL